jgi:hypothetical protein
MPIEWVRRKGFVRHGATLLLALAMSVALVPAGAAPIASNVAASPACGDDPVSAPCVNRTLICAVVCAPSQPRTLDRAQLPAFTAVLADAADAFRAPPWAPPFNLAGAIAPASGPPLYLRFGRLLL